MSNTATAKPKIFPVRAKAPISSANTLQSFYIQTDVEWTSCICSLCFEIIQRKMILLCKVASPACRSITSAICKVGLYDHLSLFQSCM